MENRTIKRVIDGKLVEITLTFDEINFLIEQKERQDLISDFIQVLSENYSIEFDDFEIIRKDSDTIYRIFNKVEDSDLSYWQNIEKTIGYLKNVSNTYFNYKTLEGRC